MTVQLNSVPVSADATANRVRMLQAKLADEPVEERVAALYQAIREEVSRVLPEQRRQFLDDLGERFPVFSDLSATEAPAVAAEPVENRSPLDMLLEQAATMTPLQKQQAADKLRQAGFPLASPAELPEQESQELARLLQLPPGTRPDAARSVQLLMFLADVMDKLDQFSWTAWSQVDSASDIRSAGPMSKIMARFVRGELSRQQMLQESDRLKKLAGAMIVAVQRIAPTVFKNYFEPITPAAIRSDVQAGLLRKPEVECWKEYEKRAGSMDSSTFERVLFGAFAQFVRRCLGPGAGQPATPSSAARAEVKP